MNELDLVSRVDRHLRQLAPHTRERESATLLAETCDEVKRLQRIVTILVSPEDQQAIIDEHTSLVGEIEHLKVELRKARSIWAYRTEAIVLIEIAIVLLILTGW